MPSGRFRKLLLDDLTKACALILASSKLVLMIPFTTVESIKSIDWNSKHSTRVQTDVIKCDRLQLCEGDQYINPADGDLRLIAE